MSTRHAVIAELNNLSRQQMETMSDADLSKFEGLCDHWSKTAKDERLQRRHDKASQNSTASR